MLIKMFDGGMLNYGDDCYCYEGYPTCNYGSQYINEIYITLVHPTIHVKTNQMNAKDIQQLIAKEFDVKEEQMIVLISKVYSGYGIGEHNEYEIYATVNMR